MITITIYELVTAVFMLGLCTTLWGKWGFTGSLLGQLVFYLWVKDLIFG